MRGSRPGLTLLEVLVALVILGLGAAGWTALAGQGVHTMQRAHAREQDILRASQVMSGITLWPRERIESFAGTGSAMGFRISVTPLTPSLYEVALADSAGGAELLRTSIYVRDGTRAPR